MSPGRMWHFERLMLFGPRALDFLGDQVIRLSVISCGLAEIPCAVYGPATEVARFLVLMFPSLWPFPFSFA